MHADTNLGKPSVNLIITRWVCSAQIWVRPFRFWDSKIRCISQMICWIEQIDWMILHADSDWMIFGLTPDLLGIFDIYWMSIEVLLVRNVLLLVPTGKTLEVGFPNCFNKSLIKVGQIVSFLIQYSKKYGKWSET